MKKKNEFKCFIANDNSNGQIVLSGTMNNIEKLSIYLNSINIKNIKLSVSAPFHCELMKTATELMRNELAKIVFKDFQTSLISNVTAQEIDDNLLIRDLLVRQIESRVRWRESINYMIKNGVNNFIEIGPGKVLSGLVKRIDKKVKVSAINNEEDINKIKNLMIDFKNKKILITGATGGIGYSLVDKFNLLGGSILATGTNEDKLNDLKKKYSKIKTIKFDISKHDEIENMIDKATSELDGLDILINNAGITSDNLSLRMKKDEWEKVININLSSTFYFCKFAIKKMLKNKYGRIINITSIVGHTGNLGQSNYSASKAGIIGMSKSLAIEYAKKNITINCVSPGFIETKMTDKISEDMKSILISRVPMNKLGTGLDVSNTVAFLSSDAASYITGETIHVNGGMYMA